MGFQKGQGGRPKGAKNRSSEALRVMILDALAQSGGVKYLKEQAKNNPGPFLSLIGKVLPLAVTGEDGGPLMAKVIHEDYAGDK